MPLFEKGSAKKAITAQTKAPSKREAIQSLKKQISDIEASIAIQQLNHGNAGRNDYYKMMILLCQIIVLEWARLSPTFFSSQMTTARESVLWLNNVNLNIIEGITDEYLDSIDKTQSLSERLVGKFTRDMMTDDDAEAELEKLQQVENNPPILDKPP
ncbi:hypothetical protein BLNAU_21727 [Blattamonas nauphoetae]|uniref:Uncharacterized protein n=1 Tax=Blattamonas nauphoetae TaxID=2049346 RepID=A0ABQ9WV34_9EUKA|nr:hypothetical protein BLNAU_21727 [Blattamonas nauphoetae]